VLREIVGEIIWRRICTQRLFPDSSPFLSDDDFTLISLRITIIVCRKLRAKDL
jgi:hypothetical protein